MSWTYTDEYYKNYTRDTWNESAPQYAAVRANLDRWNGDLLSRAAVKRGERVLDVACGDGEPSLSLARAGGKVLGIDLSERMIEIARTRAKEAALEAEFQVMDAEKLTIPDASFDLVTCRFGLQIVTDPDAAIREALRVLKPGGRLAATVWSPADRNAAMHVMVGPMLEYAEPDETGYLPTPYEMGGDGELVAILAKHGFTDARESRAAHDWLFPSEKAYFDSVLNGTPLGHSLREEDPPVQRDVLAKTAQNLKAFVQSNGSLKLPAEAVVVSAVRPVR